MECLATRSACLATPAEGVEGCFVGAPMGFERGKIAVNLVIFVSFGSAVRIFGAVLDPPDFIGLLGVGGGEF